MSLHNPETDSLVGRQFDEYLIEEPLGSGGMAQVYRAMDRKLQRRVALKVIAAKFRVEGDYIARFEREAQSIARLEHANIVRLYRYGQVGDISYMAMQFIEGADLDFLIRSYRQTNEFMSPADVLNVIRDIALALDYAHEQGVIHRDVKPGNIILDKTGRAYLSDFGLALLSDIGTQGEILGSPLYIAPEQAISSANVVPQSDLYSLGVVLFEMLTGELPFVAPDPMDVAMRHVSDPPPRPEEYNPAIPTAVAEVVLRCLEKEPAKRYQTGAALIKALERGITAWTSGVAPVKTSHLRASRLTNPEKVELRLDAPDKSTLPPLPPLPSSDPVRATATLPTPASTSVTRLRKSEPLSISTQPSKVTNRRYLPFVIGSIVLLVGAIGLLVVGLTANRANLPAASAPPSATQMALVATIISPVPAQIIPTDLPTPTAMLLPTQFSATEMIQSTLLPTITAIVIQPIMPTLQPTIQPSISPTPELATPSATTLIVLRDENSISFLNTSAVPLSLTKFELQQKDRTLTAAAWGLNTLPSGACLRLYKGNNAPKQPPKRCVKEIYDYDADKKIRDTWFRGEVKVILNETTSYTIEMK